MRVSFTHSIPAAVRVSFSQGFPGDELVVVGILANSGRWLRDLHVGPVVGDERDDRRCLDAGVLSS